MPDLTISEAARLCGVHRRTLQRAIGRGRLALTPAARLTLAALQQAGYAAAPPQDTTQGHAPHRTACDTAPQDTGPHAAAVPQVMERMADALTSIATSLALLCERLAPQEHAALAPHVAPRRSAPQRHAADQAYDPARALARMQALRAEGRSLAQIAQALNAERIPTRHGKPWQKGTVGYLLQGV